MASALKNVFDSMKTPDTYIIKDLNYYLLSIANDPDENRAIDVNAPSQIGKCMRARYYARTGVSADPNCIDARTQRIFDNGTGVHERLQGYLMDMGKLLMPELPVRDDEFNIQGHTDGMIGLEPYDGDPNEMRYADVAAVLEIKSINDRGFTELKDAKEEHKKQGLIYVSCLETRRKELHALYPSLFHFLANKPSRMKQYAKLYQHIKGGRKFTREEKIQFQCELHDRLDNILFRLKEPVEKAVFLYENKNNQELKEFTVSTKEREAKNIIKQVHAECAELNERVANGDMPDRGGRTKSCTDCRFCDYKIHCWH